jgi:anthranilate synthase component 1
MTTTPEPFGPPAQRCRVRRATLPLAECAEPLEAFLRLRGPKGGVLMESADTGAPTGRYSVVVPAPSLRLTLRDTAAVYEALDARGAALLPHLVARHGGTLEGPVARLRTARALTDPALSDRERLAAPGPLDALRWMAALCGDEAPSPLGPPSIYGAISYEVVDRFEVLPPRKASPFDDADAEYVLGLDSIAFDHLAREVVVTSRGFEDEPAEALEARHAATCARLRETGRTLPLEPHRGAVAEKEAEPDQSDEAFLAGVRSFLGHIAAGDIFQGVLSRGLTMASNASPIEVYAQLRAMNPSPYMFYLDLPDGVLLGASPETCVKVTEGEVEIKPIAGTVPRGFAADGSLDRELDTRLEMSLLLDRKEQSEHAMLVDLARNDVARVSAPGSRYVERPLAIEKYSHVQHLVSRVRGALREGLDALHAYEASANMGTLTGAPKLRAMELIRAHEPTSRGFYGGSVGYLMQDGTFDTCIVIRSMRWKDGRYLLRSGAGVVLESDPERELAETLHKARACRVAIAKAEAARKGGAS